MVFSVQYTASEREDVSGVFSVLIPPKPGVLPNGATIPINRGEIITLDDIYFEDFWDSQTNSAKIPYVRVTGALPGQTTPSEGAVKEFILPPMDEEKDSLALPTLTLGPTTVETPQDSTQGTSRGRGKKETGVTTDEL